MNWWGNSFFETYQHNIIDKVLYRRQDPQWGRVLYNPSKCIMMSHDNSYKAQHVMTLMVNQNRVCFTLHLIHFAKCLCVEVVSVTAAGGKVWLWLLSLCWYCSDILKGLCPNLSSPMSGNPEWKQKQGLEWTERETLAPPDRPTQSLIISYMTSGEITRSMRRCELR